MPGGAGFRSTTDSTSRVIASVVTNPDATTATDGYGHGTHVAGILAGDGTSRPLTDPLYGKYVRSRARYKAHDETNAYKAGDEVEIQEHRPISRDKHFVVTRLVKKFVEE